MADEQPSPSHQKTGRRLLYALIAATVVLGATCIGLGGYLIYQKVKSDSENTGNGDSQFTCPQNAPEFQEKFRGVFSSVEDLQKMQAAGIQSFQQVVNGSTGMTNVTSPFNGSTTTTALYSNQSLMVDSGGYCSTVPPRSISHCCCVSWIDIQAPNTLPSGEPGKDEDVTIYQTNDYKQYFTFTSCCQQRTCNENCLCNILHHSTSAVVVVPNHGGTLCQFQLVRVPNCCMCVNN